MRPPTGTRTNTRTSTDTSTRSLTTTRYQASSAVRHVPKEVRGSWSWFPVMVPGTGGGRVPVPFQREASVSLGQSHRQATRVGDGARTGPTPPGSEAPRGSFGEV